MKKRIRLNENDIHMMVRRSVKNVLREAKMNRNEYMVKRLTKYLTGLDEGTALMVAGYICDENPSLAEFFINHDSGYGYGGKSFDEEFEEDYGEF